MNDQARRYDAVIVGAGFAGMYMLHRLRGLGLTAHVIEAGADVGGTWYWNRYPGARCDVESLYYCYSFSHELQQQWSWSERYPRQPEILAYASHVADRFDLRRDISFSTRVRSAVFDDAGHGWSIETADGAVVRARFLITAVGNLSATRLPDIDGLKTYTGAVYHTGQWPHEPVSFTGQRVAVIGTGSSGVQAIPMIAEQARELIVLQRTPNFSVPARNRPLEPEEQAQVKANYAALRAIAKTSSGGVVPEVTGLNALDISESERRAEYERRWAKGGGSILGAFKDTMIAAEANEFLAEFTREKIRGIVHDPVTAEMLCPQGYPFGAKRLCLDTDYYATYNRDNVRLIDLRRTPIERITPSGIRVSGSDHPVDSIVFATGYDAITGPLTEIDIRGVNGRMLKSKWTAGPRTYLGLSTAGFPNMFMLTGPGSPSVLSNVLVSIEQHVDWVANHLNYLRVNALVRSEASVEAEDAWVEHVSAIASHTLFVKAASWYTGANIPGKPRVFMPYVGGVGTYRLVCDDVAAADYKGFELTRG